MSLLVPARSRAPRLLIKILGFSFGVIAAVLASVFVALTWQARERLTRPIIANQEASQRRFVEVAARRQRELRLQASVLSDAPTLKAAVDTYHAEIAHGAAPMNLFTTIQREADKLQSKLGVPALVVTGVDGGILVSAGPRSVDWARGDRLPWRLDSSGESVETVIARGDREYLATAVPLIVADDVVGSVYLAAPLDDGYAKELAAEANSDVAILVGGRVVAASTSLQVARALGRAAPAGTGSITIDGNEFVASRLWAIDAATVYAVDSVTSAVQKATGEALGVLVWVGLGALCLAGLGSWWLARRLAMPIDALTQTLATMARERDFEHALDATGVSREFDDLIDTFDALRRAVVEAEDESEAAYVGVIGSLAAALDARDPYTAGHSERVANLSVAIARQMELPEIEVETVRLGALLHDIGKIGVSDAVLRKPGKLSDDEFAQIKLHPGLGARILRPLRFLSPHLAVVELHHEQPNGRGYPHGLDGVQIPLLASIVHVADAFDAITSARAYRPSRPFQDAVDELRKWSGTQFAPDVVDALVALPVSVLIASQEAAAQASLSDDGASVRGALVQFRARAAASMRRERAAG
ncbi:MAG: HD domain-containing phosphohydrolase [Acidobacteriota bacterium]